MPLAVPTNSAPEADVTGSPDAFWSQCSTLFMQELPRQQFETWIKPLKVDSGTAPSAGTPVEIELRAPNRFVQQWVRERYVGRLESLAIEFWGAAVRVLIVCPAPADVPAPAAQSSKSPAAREAAPALSPKAADSGSTYSKTRLNGEHTFDTFVTGKANQLARAAAIQVADNPGTSYNPLFLYGGVGLGKTHLVQAIGNLLVAHRPDAKVRYIHAEQYVTDVVRAYQKKAFDEFKRRRQ